MICTYLLGLIIVFPVTVDAQEEPIYDEISVFLNIQRIGGLDITAVIMDETVYLPVVDIFSFLKIKNNPSPQLDSISGFFINPQAAYSIDRRNNRITYQGKVYIVKNGDMIKTETNLYLKSNWFGEVFGLDCIFNFRSLSVTLNTKLELPIIREMRQDQMRSNINRLKGEVKTDTIIDRKYPAFHFGMADWSVISNQQLGGKADVRFNLALGTVIAGGEANALLNYNNNSPFTEKQQQYQWRFVNNEHSALRQITAGKIFTQVTSSIYDPVVGIQFTNTPTTYRRSFGTYTLSDITEPNWIVELYVNSVLVDYITADASGFFKFEVPLVYGNSAVKLRFYGPWGEERTKEQNINIPYNFLRPNELEYSVSAGIVEDTLSSRFSRAVMNYGVSRRITIGGGVEYLSSVITGNTMPFISTSIRLMSGLMVSGEYTYGVRSKGLLNYRFPSNLQIELNYTKYVAGQKSIIYNYLEERKAMVSIPIKGKNFAAYSRLSINQIILPHLKNTNAEMLWSGMIFGVSSNFTTYGLFTDISNPYLYSNLSFTFRMPWHFTITPQAQYEYNSSDLISARTSFEKPLFKRGFLNMSYERNFRSNTQNIEFGFRYDLTFAQTGFSIRNSNNQTTLVESARGSLLYDSKTNYLIVSNRTNVGKGAITLLPYLDINANGKRDKDEPKAFGLQFRINGGTIIQNEKDTTIRIMDLTPYTSYFLELDKNSFDNIAWQMHNLMIKVNIDPDQFKTIEVPVAVMGEGSGTVYSGSRGLGRILVCFYRNDSTLAGRVLTESDGYYSYLGLKPGKYTARIDPEQLKKIKMVSSPESIPVTVNPNRDGDIIEGLDFRVSLIDKPVADTTTVIAVEKPIVPVVTPESPVKTIAKAGEAPKAATEKKAAEPVVTKQPAKTEPVTTKPVAKTEPAISRPSASVDSLKSYQIGAYKIKAVALNALRIVEEITSKPASMIIEGGYYKVRVLGLSGQAEANSLIYKIEHAQKPKVAPQKPIIKGSSKPVAPISKPVPAVSKPVVTDNKPVVDDNKPATGNKNDFIIQVGAFGLEKNANKIEQELIKATGHPVYVLFEGGYYKVQVDGFKGWKQAQEFLPKIIDLGYKEAYVKRSK
jgi:hypothetical protein